MIDRASRNVPAEKIRQCINSVITNDDLARCEINLEDRGVKAVYEMASNLYDDRKRSRTHLNKFLLLSLGAVVLRKSR